MNISHISIQGHTIPIESSHAVRFERSYERVHHRCVLEARLSLHLGFDRVEGLFEII